MSVSDMYCCQYCGFESIQRWMVREHRKWARKSNVACFNRLLFERNELRNIGDRMSKQLALAASMPEATVGVPYANSAKELTDLWMAVR